MKKEKKERDKRKGRQSKGHNQKFLSLLAEYRVSSGVKGHWE